MNRARRSTLALAAAALAAAGAAFLSLAACEREAHDPLAVAMSTKGRAPGNVEAAVPAPCYAMTSGGANGCWVCHTVGRPPNTLSDADLQREYAFSEYARQNRWANLFAARPAEVDATSDEEILAYVRQDNYEPLRRALAGRKEYPGFAPDLDLDAGFDEAGFARDGSGWRAVRYKPFPGSFWPTNGGAGDVYVRLPAPFRADAAGKPSGDVYRLNLALLEAAVASPEAIPIGDAPADPAIRGRQVEPVSEILAGFDLDGDGGLSAAATVIRRLPAHYAGGAAGAAVRAGLYPRGVELLHPVRYLDPDSPTLAARRMKELRYARKVEELDSWGLNRAREREADEKDEGHAPRYTGGPEVGLKNAFGWQLQAFIEDARGRLRLQTEEEHRACMGCHGSLGVTVDHTFSLARKVPGADGWRPQDLRGMPDAPLVGHADPEGLVYLRRLGGGDEYGGNQEMLARFFPGGALDEREARRAGPGGDRDLLHLVAPSRERALLLDKGYRALVKTQRFDLGRDPMLGPAPRAHRLVEGGSTGLGEANRVYLDGRLHLAW